MSLIRRDIHLSEIHGSLFYMINHFEFTWESSSSSSSSSGGGGGGGGSSSSSSSSSRLAVAVVVVAVVVVVVSSSSPYWTTVQSCMSIYFSINKENVWYILQHCSPSKPLCFLLDAIPRVVPVASYPAGSVPPVHRYLHSSSPGIPWIPLCVFISHWHTKETRWPHIWTFD